MILPKLEFVQTVSCVSREIIYEILEFTQSDNKGKRSENKMGAYIFLFTVFPNNDIIFKFIHTITVVPWVKERSQHKGFNEFHRNAMYITQKFF